MRQLITSCLDIVVQPHLHEGSLRSCSVIDGIQMPKVINAPINIGTILVVEDLLINQMVVKSVLEGMGYQVDIAPTGKAALDCYQFNTYDLILMDIGLPDIQGTEVTRQIRELEHGKGIHTPIIALTANDLSFKPEYLSVGMDDFSVKPFEINTFKLLIKKWINYKKRSAIINNLSVFARYWLKDILNIAKSYSQIPRRLNLSPSTVKKIARKRRTPRSKIRKSLAKYYLIVFYELPIYDNKFKSYYVKYKFSIDLTTLLTKKLF